jgi:hypothetical protein
VQPGRQWTVEWTASFHCVSVNIGQTNSLFLYCSFNQLCLPDYHSFEQLHSSLVLAINEGSEGFGMI